MSYETFRVRRIRFDPHYARTAFANAEGVVAGGYETEWLYESASIAGNAAGFLQDIVGAYAKAGATELIVPTFHDDTSETRDLLDRFIEEVVPAFR